MIEDSYLYLLAGMYLASLMLGVCFYYTMVKLNGVKWRMANSALKAFRFLMYVVLLPFGLTAAVALYLIFNEYIEIL